MLWLGLFISVASVPGVTSVTIPTGWAALSATLPIAAWRPGRIAWPHAAMILFLAYAGVSICWSTSPLSGVYRLWQALIVAGAFWLGSTVPPRTILVGLGLGGVLSSALAIGQATGWDFVYRFSADQSSGLHYNGVFSGMIAALTIVALFCTDRRLWPLALAQLPALVLSGSRGALVAAGCGLLFTWLRHPSILAGFLAAILFYAGLGLTPSDIERGQIFSATVGLLAPFGNGAGSFADLYITTGGRLVHLEHAHNDALQLAFEFGIGSVPLLAIWAALAADTRSQYWPTHCTFLLLSAITFPLYTPLAALVWALCAGHTVRDWASPSDLLGRLRRESTLQQTPALVPIPLSPERLK